MSTSAASRFYFVETRNGLYRQQVESEIDPLIADSNMAVLCFEFRDLAIQGADLFESINSLDEDWRNLVFDNIVPFDASFEKRIEKLYRSWMETSRKCLALFERIKDDYLAREFAIDSIERIRGGIREVEGILTPDADFFNGEKLATMRDKAVREYRDGAAQEV